MRDGMRRALLAGGLVLLTAGLAAAAAPVPGRAEDDDPATEPREAYLSLPEFRAYADRRQLAVDALTLIRVQRPDHSEAMVAREETGWEQVVLEGWQLTFYSQGRGPLRPVPGRHVVVQDWSGGAHCCFDYHVLHVQGTQVRREGTIRAGDCTLRAADIDGDGSIELVACDSRFAYAFDLAFAESPLVPLVYTFRDRGYVADNRKYPQVFRYRIAQERKRLAEAQQAGNMRAERRAVISLLLHTLYAGRVTEAWCGFERAYRWADRAAVRQEVLVRLRKGPDAEDTRLPFVDLAYALTPADRCR